MIQIFRNNQVFFTIEDLCEGSVMSRQLMEHHYIKLKFSTEIPVYFKIGDSVEIQDFGLFVLTSAYFPKYNSTTDGYDYEIQMDAYYMAWKNKICKYRPQYGANETSFKLTATLLTHLNVVLSNLKALGYKYQNKDFVVDCTTYNQGAFDVEKRFLIEYNSVSLIEALNNLADTLDSEWWIDGNIIYFGYCEMSAITTFEQGTNMFSMSQSESKSEYVTRLYAFGSDKNIPSGYFTGAEKDVTTDGIATDYLMLPNKSVDTEGFYAKDGYLENVNVVENDAQAIEGVVKFDDEYPKVSCAVSNIKHYDSTVKNEDGTTTTQTFWQITSTDSFATSFQKSWINRDLTLMIGFESGALLGMEFEVNFKIIDNVNYFEIVANENYGRKLPDAALCPKTGDKFFLYNWDATKVTETSLIQEARESLFERAKTYYKKAMIDNSNFTCVMDGEKFYNNGTFNFHPLGERVKLINPIFADTDGEGKHFRSSRIIGMEIKLDIPYDSPTYIVGEKASYSRLGQLEDKVESITVNGKQIAGTGGSGGSVYVIGENDITPETDSNVYSARRTRGSFLSKKKSDIAQELIRFAKGIKLGEETVDNHIGITSDGIATLTELVSQIFVSGALGSGFKLGDYNGGGDSYLEVDRLLVRKDAEFIKLVIRELQSVGGEIVLSDAAMKISKVDFLKKGTLLPEYGTYPLRYDVYRCSFLAKHDDKEIANKFVVNDLVRCQTFNIKEGTTANAKNKYYWRRVTAVGTDYIDILALSGGNYGDSQPEVGDELVQMGNTTDVARQSVLYLSAYGSDSPSIKLYKGVNDYTLDGKEIFVVSRDEIYALASMFKLKVKDGDTTKETTLAEIVANVDGLSSTVDANKQEVDGQIGKLNTTLTQNAESITSLAQKQTNTENKVSKIEQTTDKISLQVETTTNLKNSIVGSALRPWDEITKIVAAHSQKVEITSGGGVGGSNYATFSASGATTNTYTGLYFKDVRVSAGKTYVFSVWAKIVTLFDNGAYYTIKRFDGGTEGAVVKSGNIYLSIGGWKLFTATFTVPDGCTKLLLEIAVRRNGAISVCRPMIMEGTEYGGWSLSPYDKTEAGKLESGLKRAGIDLEDDTITATANKFMVKNNSGVVTASVNEDGLLEVGAGLFSGLIRKKKTIITPDKLEGYTEENSINGYIRLNFVKAGSFVELSGDIGKKTGGNYPTIILPFHNPNASNASLGVTSEEAATYLGQVFVIRNNTSPATTINIVGYTSLVGGSNTARPYWLESGWMAVLTCELVYVSNANTYAIVWNGYNVPFTAPIAHSDEGGGAVADEGGEPTADDPTTTEEEQPKE